MNRMILASMIAIASCAAAPVSAATILCPAYETKTAYISPEDPGKWVVEVKQRRFPFNINVKDIPSKGECAGYYRVVAEEHQPYWTRKDPASDVRP